MAKFWLIIPALLAAVILVYGRTDPTPRADLVYVNTSGIHTLDPARMSWTPDFRIALNIWEGLTTWDPRTNEVIAAAAHCPPVISDDGLVYRFTIRPDARWSNGDPVTAQDFIRGWRRAMEPGSAADYSFLLTRHIAGAAAYAEWRREGVAVLTALARLCDGAALSAAQVRALRTAASFAPLIPREQPPGRESSVDAVNPVDSLFLPGAVPTSTWCAIFSEYFEHHVAEMDARFMAVGLYAPDSRTLVVHLTSRCSYFTDITGLPVFLPCHKSIEQLRMREGAAPITRQGLVIYSPQWTKPDHHAFSYPGLITNGPYRLASWIFKRRLHLEVNPFYHGADGIECRTVEMRVYDNINAALMAYAAGDVDFLPSMSVPYDFEIARLARSGERPDFHLCHVMATYFLLFNCADATLNGRPNPFIDPYVRRAFALALDKTLLVENVLARGDRVAHSFVPPGIVAGYKPPRAPETDLARARALVEDYIQSRGQPLPAVDLLCTQRDQRALQAIARQWEESLGVRVNLRVLESKTYAEEKVNRRFMVATGNWYADYFDPTTFLDCLSSGSGNNDGGYVNKHYDALLARAAVEVDPQLRLEILADAETLILQTDVPLIPILHYAEPIAINPDVQGLHPNARMWFPFRSVSKR